MTGAGQQVLEAIENAVKRVLIRQRKLQRRQTELRLLQVAIMDIDNRQPLVGFYPKVISNHEQSTNGILIRRE